MYNFNRVMCPNSLKSNYYNFNEEVNKLQLNTSKEIYELYKNNKGKKGYKYNNEEVKDKFKESNGEYCCICGNKILDYSSAMTIEHIELKSTNPKKIFDWYNLLPACSVCNKKRSTKKYENKLYLDPTKNEKLSYLFEYTMVGDVKPKKNLSSSDIERVNYMITLYQLNRSDLIEERKKEFKRCVLNDYPENLCVNKFVFKRMEELKNEKVYVRASEC